MGEKSRGGRGKDRMARDAAPNRKRARSRAAAGGEKPNLAKGMRARAQIISAAEALFNRQGVDRASMRDIASAARTQPAAVYYYFASKEELLWAVWEKGGLELRKRVSEAIAPETDPWRRLDRRYVRLSLIGALSWSLFWFKKGGDTPAAISKKMLSMLRAGIDPR